MVWRARCLLALDCEFIQGFLFGRSMSANDLNALIKKSKASMRPPREIVNESRDSGREVAEPTVRLSFDR
jgi:hypothetical protein